MKNTTTAIGQLKSKVTVYCTVCGQSNRRNLNVNVYENTPEKIEKASAEIAAKAKKEYTCRICKTIIKDVENAK
ncbi:MAG: hypothetical protein WC319_08510 [Candidatus Paceibacterota bacterium]|jgi:hypothetical protein